MEYVAKQRHTCQVAPPACCAKTEPSAGDSAYNICRRPHTAPEPSFLGSGVVSGDSSEQLRTAPRKVRDVDTLYLLHFFVRILFFLLDFLFFEESWLLPP